VSLLTPVPPAGRAALDLFDDAPLAERAHVHVRWRTCPLVDVAARVPTRGRILDVGCGHGLFAAYLALDAPARDVVGIDLDARKLDESSARVVRARDAGARLTLKVGAPGAVPDGPWDAVTVVDVLYLLNAAAQRDLLARAAAQLAPGGRLLVKEMAPSPRWKARWNVVQETLAVRVAGLTASAAAGFVFVDPAEMAGWLEAEGLAVERVRLDRGYPHPHHLLVAERMVAERTVAERTGGRAAGGGRNSVDPPGPV
jgi:SAM-dependent methyltransferase